MKERVSSPTPWPGRIRDFVTELRGAVEFAPASRPGYWADAVMYRLIRLRPSSASDRLRTLTLRDGTRISYRRNRGDIQAIREIWLSPTYKPLLGGPEPKVLVDLGANIGFTTLYYARRHGATTCVAVEPDAANARLLRRNLEQNGVSAIVVEAAVGPIDGKGSFAQSAESNLGHLTESQDGVRVDVVSMATLLAGLEGSRVDLLKIDIEGGEGQLFAGDTGWLERVDSIMMELHPVVTDPAPIVACIESHGLRHIPGNTERQGTIDSFIRVPSLV